MHIMMQTSGTLRNRTAGRMTKKCRARLGLPGRECPVIYCEQGFFKFSSPVQLGLYTSLISVKYMSLQSRIECSILKTSALVDSACRQAVL